VREKDTKDRTVFLTDRLRIRRSSASEIDVAFFYALWTNPRVMINVGFPQGLRITEEAVRGQLAAQPASDFDIRLVAELKDSSTMIGECKLGRPDHDGVCETDVKLLPKYWGQGFGTEIKQTLVDYLFTHTDCTAVKATPNKSNLASQRMQEAVGGKRVGEGVFTFPEHMRDYTCDVPHYVYMVFRTDWEQESEY
jgi:RimJ/RimL family protein N-acetyltransferase